MVKSLFDISWNVTEKEYRSDEALSYSTISFFEREGFRKLDELSKDIDSPAIRYGSLLDTILTENEELENKFYILDTQRPSDAIARMVERSLELSKGEYQKLMKIPREVIVDVLNEEGYYANWSEAKRVEKIYKEGYKYYDFLLESKGRVVIGKDQYDLARRNAATLKTHPYTSKYFIKNPFKNIEHLYQLKFKTGYKDGAVRCMFDLILVDHDNKTITPCDLKTTSYDEDSFESSFIKWGYILQAQLYTYILKQTISKDEYFKDFTIGDYEFIVINKFNNTPLVWTFKNNHHEGDYLLNNGVFTKVIRGWKSIYDDLIYHLTTNNFEYPKEAVENNGSMIIKNIDIIETQSGD